MPMTNFYPCSRTGDLDPKIQWEVCQSHFVRRPCWMEYIIAAIFEKYNLPQPITIFKTSGIENLMIGRRMDSTAQLCTTAIAMVEIDKGNVIIPLGSRPVVSLYHEHVYKCPWMVTTGMREKNSSSLLKIDFHWWSKNSTTYSSVCELEICPLFT